MDNLIHTDFNTMHHSHPASDASTISHSLTVDVEEYFHAANLEVCFGPGRWHSLPSRVENSTRFLLDLFDEANAKGTFFVLGCVARRHPNLVREILHRGHELASHGYGHRIVGTQSPRSFFRDVRKAKLLLESIAGIEIRGYRAPNFSIVDSCLWAYDELCRAGYRYDSSLYPVRHPRYGNASRSREPEQRETAFGPLQIFPLSVLPVGPFRLGVAGGGWWRLLPRQLIEFGTNQLARTQGLNCYLHPWELDPEQPTCDSLSLVNRFRHYTGLETFHEMIRSFLQTFGSSPLGARLP